MALIKQAMVNQQDVERVVIAATKLIHTPQISQQILKMMKAAGDPAAALAQTTVFIMKTLIDHSNGTIPTNTIVPAGRQVVDLLAEIAAAAKLFKADRQVIGKAIMLIAKGLQRAAQMQKNPQQPKPAPQPAPQPVPQTQGIVGQAMGA